MGVVLEIGVQVRKFVIISKRICYRSVCNHPFIVGMLLFLLFLYRSFPFLFSVLVSASPVLVCTAVLLGTLLSFGHPNIPEIEKEDKLTHDYDVVASLRTGVSRDETVVVEREASFSAERFSGKTRDAVDASVEENGSYTECRVRSTEVEDHDRSVDYEPLINENLEHAQKEERVIEDVERELKSPELRKNHEDKLGTEGVDWDVEPVEQQYTLVQNLEDDISPRESVDAYKGDHLNSSMADGGGDEEAVEQHYTLVQQVEDDISPRESVDAYKVDHFDSSLAGSGGDDEADEDVDYETSDSESDRAESSSPDASMADILPMLDELHPLLDSEAPQPAHVFHDESDAASDRSNRSNDGSVESDEETENQGGEVEEDGVDHNDGDEEEAHGGKKDESKSAISWTEDDQKNLMDLGNLELERNLRLENLIARRRARKSFKLTAEQNLIDFDSADLPFNVAPISTTRHNPFDLPYDSYDNMGLPPIPGSAPSVMLARRNPFDLPYESNEEKPDLKGDHFEQEFIAIHSKDTFFRRHESFSLGPSGLGPAKQERQEFKWKPVFVPERLAEGTSSSSFQRQSSEVSESKLSSVPDTESVNSAADLDERKFSEHDFTTETEVIANIYHVPDLVEHGSQSSEDAGSLEMEQAGERDDQHDELEIKLGESQSLEPSFSGTGGLANLMEHITDERHLKPEPAEDDNSSRSSLSSLSEVDEKISDVMKGGSTSLEERGNIINEFVISPQPSLLKSEIQFTSGMVDDNEHKEPVYDSSPLPTEKILSFTSISSEVQAEISAMVTHIASNEMHIPFVDQDSKVHGESIEKGTSDHVEINGASSKVHASNEIERSLGTGNQLDLAPSHSEDIYPPKNLDVKTASSDPSNQPALSEKQPPSEEKKVLSWSDKSKVEPYFDDHEEELIITEAIDEVKEIDAGLLSELDTVGDFSVKEVDGEPLHTDELIPEEENVASTESGDLNLPESNLEQPILEARSIDDIDMGFKKIRKGLDLEEVIVPSILDNQQEVGAAENTVQTISEFPGVEARSFEDIFTASEGNVNELPQLLDATDASTELPLEYIHTILRQVSEGNNVDELPKPSNSNDGLEEVGTTAVGSTEEIGSREEILESHVDESPTNSNVGSEEVGTISMGSTEEIVSSNVVSSVQENIRTHTASKQVSEGHVDELTKPRSTSNDVSEEVEANAMGSTEEIEISYTVSSFHDDISSHTALKQDSESDVDELPKPTPNSNDGLEEVGANAMGSTEEIEMSNTVSSVHDDISSHTALKQDPESHVDEFPKPTPNSNDESEDVRKEVASSNIVSTVQEDIMTHTPLKLDSEIHVGELSEPISNSSDGSEDVGTIANAVDPIEEVVSSNIVSSVQEHIPTHTPLKQDSESDVDELLKRTLNPNDGWEEVGTNAAGSTEEIALQLGVQETVTTPATLTQVLGSEGDDELPKSPNSNDGLEEVGTNAAGSTEEFSLQLGVQETVTTPATLKQHSGSDGDDELLKSPNSQDGLAKGPNATDLPVETIRNGS